MQLESIMDSLSILVLNILYKDKLYKKQTSTKKAANKYIGCFFYILSRINLS